MQKKNELDIVERILDACYKSGDFPLFVMSLMHQYEERGSLSKKQLQGLYYKAEKIKDIPASWLATLQAKIAKMPNRFKQTDEIQITPLYQKNKRVGEMIDSILHKYPLHKRVLFLKTKYDNNETLTAVEATELEKFVKLLL